jgi:hypothetical protein
MGTLMRKPDENNHLKDIDINGSVKLKWFLKNWNGRTWAAVNCFVLEMGGRLL